MKSQELNPEPIFDIDKTVVALRKAYSGLTGRGSGSNLEIYMDLYIEQMLEHFAPKAKQPSAKRSKALIAIIENRSLLLWKSLAQLRGPAIDALGFHKPTIGEMEKLVYRLYQAASNATLEPPPKGRRADQRSLDIACLAAQHFAEASAKRRPTRNTHAGEQGKMPSISESDFTDFLKKVFCAFDIRRGVDRYAKLAISEWSKREYRQTINDLKSK
jgi:hypothetical protein